MAQGRIPTVTAVHFAPDAAGLYLGFASGEVVHYDVARGGLSTLPRTSTIAVSAHHPIVASASEPSQSPRVESLASDPAGERLAILTVDDDTGHTALNCYGPGSLGVSTTQHLQGTGLWLSPTALGKPDFSVIVTDGRYAITHNDANLIPSYRFALPQDAAGAVTGLFQESVYPAATKIRAILFGEQEVWLCPLADGDEAPTRHAIGWTPEVREGSSLHQPPLAWLPVGANELELVGLTAAAVVRWARLQLRDYGIDLIAARQCSGSYLAATLVREGFTAAVRRDGIDWIRITATACRIAATSAEAFPNAIACFPFHAGQELIIVGGDGSIYRVPLVMLDELNTQTPARAWRGSPPLAQTNRWHGVWAIPHWFPTW